jgi:pyroglutamyl-peptidase
MHYRAENKMNIPAGFIHVPSLPEQVIGKNQPSMALSLTTEALGIVLETLSKEI